MAGLRARRIENEWLLLGERARADQTIEVLGRETRAGAEVFRVNLLQTPGFIRGPEGLREERTHRVEFSFPRFFPALPIEATLAAPAFHPNIHPENGFVCLWSRHDPEHTVLAAIRQLRLILAGKIWNADPRHVLQAEALEWLRMDGEFQRFQKLKPPAKNLTLP